jgi:hypothetical protein
MSERTENGRKFRTLNIIDEFSRVYLAINVNRNDELEELDSFNRNLMEYLICIKQRNFIWVSAIYLPGGII